MALNDKAAIALRSQYRPSQIVLEFPADLQNLVGGACPSVDCCSEIKSPMLGTLSQAFPEAMLPDGTMVENTAITWMKTQMVAVSLFANVKEKMTDWQIESVCKQILVEHPNTTMMEFVLFCSRLRSGRYEDFYGSVDPMRIMKSFYAFISDKRKDYARKYEKEEAERREREWEQAKKNAVSYQEWRAKEIANGRKEETFAQMDELFGEK